MLCIPYNYKLDIATLYVRILRIYCPLRYGTPLGLSKALRKYGHCLTTGSWRSSSGEGKCSQSPAGCVCSSLFLQHVDRLLGGGVITCEEPVGWPHLARQATPIYAHLPTPPPHLPAYQATTSNLIAHPVTSPQLPAHQATSFAA